MKNLRLVHLYLGSLFGPLLIVFAVSGAWQVLRWNDAKKDGSYKPSAAITLFTDIHKDQTLPGVPRRRSVGMQYFAIASAAGLTLTTILGIIMAYRLSRRPIAVTLCLAAGIGIPILLLLWAR